MDPGFRPGSVRPRLVAAANQLDSSALARRADGGVAAADKGAGKRFAPDRRMGTSVRFSLDRPAHPGGGGGICLRSGILDAAAAFRFSPGADRIVARRDGVLPTGFSLSAGIDLPT